MPSFPIRRVWRYQWLRIVRFGSAVDTLIAVISKSGALIGTSLIGIAFVFLLPEATGQVVVREALSTMLADYLFVLCAAALMINLWISGRTVLDLSAYKFYPISLAKLAAVVQVIRVIHVRYLSIGLAAAIVLVLVAQRITISPLLAAGLLILLLDSLTLFLQIVYAEYIWIFILNMITLLGFILVDIRGGHFLSQFAFEAWTGSTGDGAYSFLILFGITTAALVASHRQIQTLLRYGSWH